MLAARHASQALSLQARWPLVNTMLIEQVRVQAKEAELAALRAAQAEPGRMQRPQRGSRARKPQEPKLPVAAKQEVHFSQSAWLSLLRTDA